MPLAPFVGGRLFVGLNMDSSSENLAPGTHGKLERGDRNNPRYCVYSPLHKPTWGEWDLHTDDVGELRFANFD